MTTRTYEGDDEVPQIFVDIRIRRTIGSLPPMALAAWQGLKGVMFLGSMAGLLAVAVWPELEVAQHLRVAMALVAAWLVYDQVIARHHYGVSHVLCTTKGVLFTDENLYVLWEDIESYKVTSGLLRLRPAPGHGPRGLFAPKELDIPLSDGTRDFVVGLFRERGVEMWRPR